MRKIAVAIALLALMLAGSAQAAKPNPIREYGAKPSPIREYGKLMPNPIREYRAGGGGAHRAV